MSVFAYTALAKDGRKTSGTLSADTRAALVGMLAKQGLSPIKIEEARDAASAAKKAAAASGSTQKKVPAKAVESFTRELANLLAGGVPLARAMSLLKREAHNPTAKATWTQLHDDVVGGTTLADAMAKHPKTFPVVYVAMVRAGETGGFLEGVLTQIVDFREREQELKGKVKAAMVYPAFLAVMATGVLIFLMTFFIPTFSGIFAQFGGNLPKLTVVIVGASNIVKAYGIYIAVALVIGIMLFLRMKESDAGRRKIEMVTLATPLLGTVLSQFALVRFARMLGTLIKSGVPLVQSLRTARDAIGNQVLADTVNHAIEQVQRGEAMSKALGSSPKLFPPSVIEMVAVAEETGRLDQELLRVAVSYEKDLDRQLKLLVSIAEPLMLFLMAGIIGTVVVGMLLPVFNLQDLIK